MAAAGRPVSELYPLGGAVSMESTLCGQSLFDTSKSSTQAISPCGPAGGGPGYACQGEPKEAMGEHPAAPPTRGAFCSSLRVVGERREQPLTRPRSLAESHPPSHHHEIVVNAINDDPQAGRTAQSTKPATLPIHRSHSGTLPPRTHGVTPPPAPDHDTCGLAYHGGGGGGGGGGDRCIQEAESHSMLACKQPMQLQQCNIITTTCRGVNGGEGGAQQPPTRCVCMSSPKAAPKVEGVEKKDHLPSKCDNAFCYGSYIHHTNFEDTFAAYCHPQPIPAPSQVLGAAAAVAPPLAMNHLTLPRLISSVSETGLDAKHLLRCCNLNCSWISSLPPGAGPQTQKHFGLEECCGGLVGHVRTVTRDTGTMTVHKELRDVGVQTGQAATPHVFPQICLAEERRGETPNSDGDGGNKPGGAPKSPVKEVKWDAEGMTWEVYGASVDPEELGLAIQRHLELQIKETASQVAKLSRQDTNTSRQSANAGRQRKRSRMMASIRTPACCARTSTAVD